MKRVYCLCLIVALVLCFGIETRPTMAQETGHYVNGVEGIKAATLPPPGFYWRLYNLFYSAHKMIDENGNKAGIGFDIDVFAFVNRFIWVSDKKILGGNYAFDIIIPVVNTEITIAAKNIKNDKFGLGDIVIEPFVLSWHMATYDLSFGLAAYLPTGSYDKNNQACPGKDFWTQMTTLGGTYYLDQKKTWSASVLARYEIHTEKGDQAITPGHDFHFEWGIGKTIAKVWDVGVAGYCQWQVTDDRGSEARDKEDHDQVFALGPEVSSFMPEVKLFLSLRALWEFGANNNRSEGRTVTLTITKPF